MTLLKKPSQYRGWGKRKNPRRKKKVYVENQAYKLAMYQTKLELSHTQSKCPVCLYPLLAMGDGHHVLVRRGSYPPELLYVTENVRLVHHKCHMEDGSYNVHAVAMILRDYDLGQLGEWLDGLGVTGRDWDVVTGELWRVRVLLQEDCGTCPQCGRPMLHEISDGRCADDGPGTVCWNCWGVYR